MSKSQSCYLVMLLQKERQTNIGIPIKMEWAEGMIGALPVFRTKKAALKYAGKGNKHLVVSEPDYDDGRVIIRIDDQMVDVHIDELEEALERYRARV